MVILWKSAQPHVRDTPENSKRFLYAGVYWAKEARRVRLGWCNNPHGAQIWWMTEHQKAVNVKSCKSHKRACAAASLLKREKQSCSLHDWLDALVHSSRTTGGMSIFYLANVKGAARAEGANSIKSAWEKIETRGWKRLKVFQQGGKVVCLKLICIDHRICMACMQHPSGESIMRMSASVWALRFVMDFAAASHKETPNCPGNQIPDAANWTPRNRLPFAPFSNLISAQMKQHPSSSQRRQFPSLQRLGYPITKWKICVLLLLSNKPSGMIFAFSPFPEK